MRGDPVPPHGTWPQNFPGASQRPAHRPPLTPGLLVLEMWGATRGCEGVAYLGEHALQPPAATGLLGHLIWRAPGLGCGAGVCPSKRYGAGPGPDE